MMEELYLVQLSELLVISENISSKRVKLGNYHCIHVNFIQMYFIKKKKIADLLNFHQLFSCLSLYMFFVCYFDILCLADNANLELIKDG